MPTNKKLVINGQETQPIKKTKLPANVDWQAIANKKKKEDG